MGIEIEGSGGETGQRRFGATHVAGPDNRAGTR